MHPLAFLFFFLLSIANCEDPRASQASLYTSNVVLYFLFLSYSEVDVRPPACMPVYGFTCLSAHCMLLGCDVHSSPFVNFIAKGPGRQSHPLLDGRLVSSPKSHRGKKKPSLTYLDKVL